VDGGAKYVQLLLAAAVDKSRPLKGQLFFYRAVLLIQPENETALIELMKAKNMGVADTSFEALLAAWNGAVAPGEAKPPPVPPADPGHPSSGKGGPDASGGGTPPPGKPGEAAEPATPKAERVTFFRWDEQRKTVKYLYRPVNKNETALNEMTSFVAENGTTVNSPLDDGKQCVKLIDGKLSAKHRVNALSVGWRGQPPLICFVFASPVSPRVCRIFIYGYDGGNSASMPSAITVYDGTADGPRNKVGTRSIPASRRTCWIEIPLDVKTPCVHFWICMERSPRDNVIVDEVEFK
jgi:hypothetical protein